MLLCTDNFHRKRSLSIGHFRALIGTELTLSLSCKFKKTLYNLSTVAKIIRCLFQRWLNLFLVLTMAQLLSWSYMRAVFMVRTLRGFNAEKGIADWFPSLAFHASSHQHSGPRAGILYRVISEKRHLNTPMLPNHPRQINYSRREFYVFSPDIFRFFRPSRN